MTLELSTEFGGNRYRMMVRWLTHDHGLSNGGTRILPGSPVTYQVAYLFLSTAPFLMTFLAPPRTPSRKCLLGNCQLHRVGPSFGEPPFPRLCPDWAIPHGDWAGKRYEAGHFLPTGLCSDWQWLLQSWPLGHQGFVGLASQFNCPLLGVTD